MVSLDSSTEKLLPAQNPNLSWAWAHTSTTSSDISFDGSGQRWRKEDTIVAVVVDHNRHRGGRDWEWGCGGGKVTNCFTRSLHCRTRRPVEDLRRHVQLYGAQV